MTKPLTFVPATVRSFAPNGVCALCGADILLPALPEPRTRRRPRPAPTLSQVWLGALAEERRTRAPLETLGWISLALAAGLAVVPGLLGGLEWVSRLTGFNAWVSWMLGVG